MNKFIYFLSKTDKDLVQHCPQNTRSIQLALGFFVLLTGLLGFFSGTYAVSNMFIHEDSATGRPIMAVWGWPASIVLGIIYAVFIMAIDREIVSAADKRAAVFRLPLAIVISFVVSVPVELQLFESRIEEQILESGRMSHDSLRNQLRNDVRPWESRRDTLLAMKKRARESATYWSTMAEVEVRGGDRGAEKRPSGEGPAYRAAMENINRQENLIRDLEAEQTSVENQIKILLSRNDTRFSQEKKNNSFDLLSRYMALHQLKKNPTSGSSASRMSWGVTLLFLLFELIPALMKILLPQSDYDVLLEKRRELNIISTKRIYEEARNNYYELDAEEISKRNPEIMKLIYKSQSIGT